MPNQPKLNFMNRFFLAITFIALIACQSQKNMVSYKSDNSKNSEQVNVFLGTSGDHGQMSPAASYPFSMLSIGPRTDPNTHSGYDHYAKQFDGFVHTHMEGVGCTGSGGNILIKPILDRDIHTSLIKTNDVAQPGFYGVTFENGIRAEMSVLHNFGLHHYEFPDKNNALYVDLAFAFVGRFKAEEHERKGNVISGWVDTETTCSRGVYRIYYCLEFSNSAEIKPLNEHQYIILGDGSMEMEVRVGFSSVNTEYAQARIPATELEQVKLESEAAWNHLFNRIEVDGEPDREDLFYSLLYRGLQAPFLVSEKDGVYPAIDGSVQKSETPIYNGWAIWDNYREQLPMLSLAYPEKYGDIAKSIANLYPYGKNNWATMHEPSPTVRTEHAMVVLLDAYRKGYDIPLNDIKTELLNEASHLDFGAPDKALESSYDCWAMSEILKITGDTALSQKYFNKALEYKKYWLKDFADLSRDDIDRMQARGLYQGTIWQYRWFVPFDVAGLKELAGGENEFVKQLDQFFRDNDYNHANQPDLQVPGMYNATSEPWKSQKLYRNLLLDTVVQCYFNDNSKGVDPYIGRIYKNQPRAYLRTMDDDAGTMSSWFVMRSIGLSPANIGSPVYYLTAPVFKSVNLNWENGRTFHVEVSNYDKDNFYIKKATFNGHLLARNWLTQEELMNGGELILETSDVPNKQWGIKDQWISSVK